MEGQTPGEMECPVMVEEREGDRQNWNGPGKHLQGKLKDKRSEQEGGTADHNMTLRRKT